MGGQPASDPSINSRSDKRDSDSHLVIKPNSFPHASSPTSIQTLHVTGREYALSLQNLTEISQVDTEQAIGPYGHSSSSDSTSHLSFKEFSEVAQAGSTR